MNQLARDAKRLGRAAEAAIKKIEAAAKEIAASRGKVERHLSDSFSWAFLHEPSYLQLLILLMAALGMIDEFLETAKNADNPREAVLD